MDAGARCDETLAYTSKFRPQTQTKCRSTVYVALPEDHDRHEKRLLKYEDPFRVRNGEIHRHSLALGVALLQFYPSLCAELRVAFVLNLLDLVDEEGPGVLGAREEQGVLHMPIKILLPSMVPSQYTQSSPTCKK